MPEKKKQSISNKSLARALSILDLFTSKDYSWGIRDMARELGSDPATVYRAVKTMYEAGFLEKNPNTNHYQLSPKFLMMAEIYTRHNPVQVVAQNVFEIYSQKFSHNFYLGKLLNDKIIYMTVLEGKGPITISVTQGVSIDLYCSALGKAMLAYQEDQYIEEYLNKTELKAFTKYTITDPQKLWEEINKIRETGYALNHSERHKGVGSVGVPLVQNKQKGNLAVSLAYPQHMVDDQTLILEDLIDMVKEISIEISSRAAIRDAESVVK